MNKRQFTLIAFVAMFTVMILLPMTIMPNLGTTGAPITQNEIDHFGETLPDGTLYYDYDFPTNPMRSYLPSSEGDLSSDSITSFSETTPDDTLFYPDAFTEALAFPSSGDSGVTPVGTLDKTHVDDGDDYSARTSASGDAWVTTNFTALAPIEYFYYNIEGWGAGGSTAFLYVYDWTADTWVSLNAVNTATPTWYSGTLHDSDYWSGCEISLKIESFSTSINWASMDYAAVTFTVMHLADSGHYGESFADVSEWDVGREEATESVSTDGDVMTYSAEGDSAGDVDYAFDTSISMSYDEELYYEFRYKVENTDGNSWSLYLDDGDYDGTGALDSPYIGWPALTESTDWVTEKGKLSSGSMTGTFGANIETVVIRSSMEDTVDVEFYIDYFRIGPADEMGWQHDCSTTEGVTARQSGYTYSASSDGDTVTTTSTYSVGSVWAGARITYDTTSIQAKPSRDYYPLMEIRYRYNYSAGLAMPGIWAQYDGYGYAITGGAQNTWLTTRVNMLASTTARNYNYIWFYGNVDEAGDTFTYEIDYVQIYSIADWDVGGTSLAVSDIVYVSDSALVFDKTSSSGIGFTSKKTMSVSTTTYPVWNLTVSNVVSHGGGYDWYYRPYMASGLREYAYNATRGDYLIESTMTVLKFGFKASATVSAIKFWEDAVAPTIEEKWSTPQDPDTGDDVTISIVTTDVVGVYEATATPLTEPSGSSVGTKTFTLVDTNPSGAMFWTTTIDSTDLIAGNYVFEIEATDVVNSDYEYLTFTVIQETQTKYIRIFDSLGDFVPFETFEVYRNGSRQYTDTFEGENGYAYQIQVKDRWGETLNTTTFATGVQELVVTVEVYSLKVMSWHDNFVRFNVTRAGLTYSEIVAPLEIINFRLYTNTYDWEIDFLNGTSTTGNIALTNSTALIVTGDTISDVLGLVTTVNEMTTAINITTTTISTEVVTVQLMFDWSNTTLYNQSINIIAAFNWDNTTLYNQTISIAAAFNATNTVLYDQIILIQNMFNWENTTLFNQTVSILNAFNSTNTVIYSQTISILADISNVNSTIYAQTVQMLLDLENSNSTLYSQTVTLLANIANIDSDIVTQTVTILADIENVNSTLYSQTVQLLADISNMNTTIYDQTVTLLANIANLDSDIVAQTVTILADIENVNSTLYAQTVTLLSDISNVNSTLYTQTVTMLSNIQNTNSTLYAQTVSILSQITNMNSTIYSQTVTILSSLTELNATMYLIDDPTHLNPMVLGSDLSDDYCDFTIVTYWHNASLSIYDNDVLQSGPTSELLCPIRYPLSDTAGTHNLSVLVDAGADSFWYNISYTVVETAFRVDSGPYTETDTRNYFSGYVNIGFNYSVYDNNSLSKSGTKSAGSFSIDWSKSTLKGLHEWGILFNSSGTLRWVNGSYGADGLLILNLWPGQDNDSIYLSGRLYSTDLTLSYWVWENTGSGNVLVGSGDITIVESTAWFTLYWDKSSENVAANWTLTITDGSNNSTAYGWYTKLDSAVTNITNNASHYEDNSMLIREQTVIEGDAYDGPSPEAAQWQAFGMIGLAFGMVFLVGATYYAAMGYRARRKKRDRTSDFLVTRR